MIVRRYRLSKFYIQREVEGFTYFEAYFGDLTDEDLQDHFNMAMAGEDYEYLNEVHIEAGRRDLELIWEDK